MERTISARVEPPHILCGGSQAGGWVADSPALMHKHRKLPHDALLFSLVFSWVHFYSFFVVDFSAPAEINWRIVGNLGGVG